MAGLSQLTAMPGVAAEKVKPMLPSGPTRTDRGSSAGSPALPGLFRLLLKASLLLLALLAAPTGTIRSADLDFLVPGISLRSVSFETGALVSYLIISESYGVADTSFVQLGVLEASGEAALLEVATSPYPRVPEETIWVRLLLEEGVRKIENAGEFKRFVREVLVREGDEGPFERPDEEEMEELELERMFLPSKSGTKRDSLGFEEIETPAGRFRCDIFGIEEERTMEVKLGGVDAVRYEREKTTIWLSPEIPFWGLVRSRVERESSTTLPDERRFQPRPKETRTESVLVSYTRPDAD